MTASWQTLPAAQGCAARSPVRRDTACLLRAFPLLLQVCADTIVGNEMIRGISGGQKKRVTTGEMIVGPCKTLYLDEVSLTRLPAAQAACSTAKARRFAATACWSGDQHMHRQAELHSAPKPMRL